MGVVGDRDMEHSEKLRRLEESRQQRRLGGIVIYPVANQLGCAMAPFAFPQLAEARRAPTGIERVAELA